MDRNLTLEIHPVDFTNDPALAGQNDKLIAINVTLQITCSGSAAPRAWGFRRTQVPAASPTSCAPPIVRAPARPSSSCARPPKNDSISGIVPTLSAGTHVSASKNDINYVVTAYGVAASRRGSACGS